MTSLKPRWRLQDLEKLYQHRLPVTLRQRRPHSPQLRDRWRSALSRRLISPCCRQFYRHLVEAPHPKAPAALTIQAIGRARACPTLHKTVSTQGPVQRQQTLQHPAGQTTRRKHPRFQAQDFRKSLAEKHNRP